MYASIKGCLTLSFILLATGCGKNSEGAAAPQAPPQAVAPTPPETVATSFMAPSLSPTNNSDLLFKDAVLTEPPDGEQRPPDRTFAGKNVAAIFEQISGADGAPGLWDKIALTTSDGKRLQYVASLKTDLGTIEIQLFPEAAPNHVRNFIALAQSGYYNGLPFHRTLRGNVDGNTVAYLEGGCPLGTGEFGSGSVGYWLKPEISATLTHEEGTVGAVHGETMESAACKFYVCLTRSPGMDGSYTIFGKITKGLDVAHAIHKRPVVDDGDLSDRPREPVVIRTVTIHASATDNAVVARTP